jgi:hypothetical protein
VENDYLKGSIDACDQLTAGDNEAFAKTVKQVTGMTDSGLERCEHYQSILTDRIYR